MAGGRTLRATITATLATWLDLVKTLAAVAVPVVVAVLGYLTFIGRWKELTPPDVLAIPRERYVATRPEVNAR